MSFFARRWIVLSFPLVLILQTPPQKTQPDQPKLPVVDENACPFEGCVFRKWIVSKDGTLFSSWESDRMAVGKLAKGEVVEGLTGVHITWTPDRVQVLKPIADLHARPGDTILRYMYRGEGFADIWVNGEWKKQYDSSFVQEKDGTGCGHDCAGKVVSVGRKAWWVRVKTRDGKTGWTRGEGQFDCMDALSGSMKCESLQKQ